MAHAHDPLTFSSPREELGTMINHSHFSLRLQETSDFLSAWTDFLFPTPSQCLPAPDPPLVSSLSPGLSRGTVHQNLSELQFTHGWRLPWDQYVCWWLDRHLGSVKHHGHLCPCFAVNMFYLFVCLFKKNFKSRMAGTQEILMFNIFRSWKVIFPTGNPTLHLFQQCMRAPVFQYPLRSLPFSALSDTML